MKNKTLERLIQDYLNGSIEDAKMNEYLKEYSLEEVKQYFKDSMEVDYLISKKYLQIDQESAFTDFLNQTKIPTTPENKPKKLTINYYRKYAAIFLGIVGLGMGLTFLSKSNMEQEIISIAEKEVNLQLGNGRLEIIKGSDSNNILDSEGKVIAVQTGDKIKYNPEYHSEEIKYNELSVPYGKKFELELSDGTIVYVNSGSSLKYPVNLEVGNHRRVYLKGEAFFKVTKNVEFPFIVNTGAVNIKVLGTEFNVSAYSEDDQTSTVLVSGSVQLYDSITSNNEQINLQLIPGEKGTWNKEQQSFNFDKVDTSIYTSWIQGKLIFRDMPFKQIRMVLERRYNVIINNTNKALDNNTFSANFEEESIEEILEILDRSYGIDYSIKDNQIFIN